MPSIMQEPVKPPKMAGKSKALAKMFRNTSGTMEALPTTTTTATAT